MVREVARLSTFLRTFGNVCHPDEKYLDDENDILEQKREAEIIKRRLLAKRKAEEDGRVEEIDISKLFGANIPFNVDFKEPKIPPEKLKLFTRPNSKGKFHLSNEINFQYQEKPKQSR